MSLLDLFITPAYAAGSAPAQAGSPFGSIIFMVVILVLFYVFLILPQSKRAKKHKALLEGLSKGDEVITSGGILGKISKLDDEFLEVTIAEGVNIKVQRPAVAAVVPKGTVKAS